MATYSYILTTTLDSIQIDLYDTIVADSRFIEYEYICKDVISEAERTSGKLKKSTVELNRGVYTFTNLDEGRKYIIKVLVYESDGIPISAGETEVQLPYVILKNANLNKYSIDVPFEFASSVIELGNITFYCKDTLGLYPGDVRKINGSTTQNNIVTFNNLEPNTTYDIWAVVYVSYNNDWESDPVIETTLPYTAEPTVTTDYYVDINLTSYDRVNKRMTVTFRIKKDLPDSAVLGWYDLYINDVVYCDVRIEDRSSLYDETGDEGDYKVIMIAENVPATNVYKLCIKKYDIGNTSDTYDSKSGTETLRILNSFSWDTDKVQNKPFNLTAVEWNRLTDTINAIRSSKALGSWGFTEVRGASNGYSESQSTKFTADIYNEVVVAINSISGHSNSLGYVLPNNPITATCLNVIKDVVNNIIDKG